MLNLDIKKLKNAINWNLKISFHLFQSDNGLVVADPSRVSSMTAINSVSVKNNRRLSRARVWKREALLFSQFLPSSRFRVPFTPPRYLPLPEMDQLTPFASSSHSRTHSSDRVQSWQFCHVRERPTNYKWFRCSCRFDLSYLRIRDLFDIYPERDGFTIKNYL